MQKTLVIFSIVAAAALSMLGYGYIKATPDPGGLTGSFPAIEIIPEFFDFGEVAYGEVAKHIFVLKNTGSQPLELKRISTSCACTTAKATVETILPGQQTKLTVSYDTGAMSGPHGKGDQERIIYIQSNDPMKPQIEAIIHARVN
ncbi:MAG: DUF1573 domain-containing protein [Candidatus Nealsonbacteria bacterium]|nr:DUF1573 domain-containing protein [Candidatus Nealsonbacteria bacterium]